MIYLWMSIIIVVCYFIGNINFARIFTWKFKNKDITQEGSKNPGMTNVLRTHGFGLAMLTMVFEFLKGGVPAFISAVVMEKYFPGMFYVVDLTAGLAAMLGQIFPIIYKFKGGKGVAVLTGVFIFSPLWWVALSLFVIFAGLSFLIKYGSHINLSFILCMTIAVTIYNIFWVATAPYYWIAIILVWSMFILELIKHRKNIQRLIAHNENKIDLIEIIRKGKERKQAEKAQQEANNKEVNKEE